MKFAFYNLHFAFFILLIAGCSYMPSLPSIPLPSLPWSTPQIQPNATAEVLFEDGMTHFNNKKYALAIDRFQKVKTDFPFSPQLVSAELKLAEAYYLNKQYPEAVAAFKEFQSLHPNNENTPFVAYHLGLVHFDQFTNVDRDQKMTELARGYFETVVKNYPNSPHASQAKEKLAKCLEYLAEHEFNIASFYFREKKYPAAIDRLEGILRRYRDTTIAAKALYYLGDSYRLDKNPLKAALAYEALTQYHPNDPLTKTAQAQLSELSKERVDPLALLLKRDAKPAFASPPEIRNPKSEIQNPNELNLVAKKEVVHEEPGDEKGILRRVADTLNPLAWFSSSDGVKKENGNQKTDAAKKEEKTKVEAGRDPQLVANVDQSLKRQGIEVKSQNAESAIQNPQSKIENLELRPPASDLPKVEEQTQPPTDTAELVGRIDANLKKEGKNVTDLPPPPEPAPVLKASTVVGGRTPATAKVETPSAPVASGLVSNIDEALRRKGIDPDKRPKTEDGGPKTQESIRHPSPVPGQEKIELSPRLPTEKKPFLLDPREYRAEEVEKESEPKEKPQTEKPAEPLKGFPQAVVKGPPQPAQEKPPERKPAETKKSQEDDEESKGVLEQLKEDIGRVRKLLNPFEW